MHLIKNKFVLVGVLLAWAGMLGYAGFAAAGGGDDSPGSVEDPLVTRSFVEQYVQKYIGEAGSVGGGSLEWQTMTLAEQGEFIGKAGTELIVRSGSAVVVDPSGSGIVDLTAGQNVLAGQVAEKNHLYTIPKTDGRGIKAQISTIIMYRGF